MTKSPALVAAEHHEVMNMIGKPKPLKSDRPKKSKTVKVKKLDPDYFFSLCVRERADWICQSCGKKYMPWEGQNGYPANPGLHCSHYFGRAIYATRFDPINVFAHCYFCHTTFEGNPHVFKEWVLYKLGQGAYDILLEKSTNRELEQQARHEKQQIAEHYRKEFAKMMEARSNGHIGRLNFDGYL